jgi:hypothetical protein
MDKRLYIALGVLVLLGIGVYFTYGRKGAEEGADHVSDPWHRIDRAQIDRIVIQRPNNAPAIELTKRDNKWQMAQPAQGPADEQAVNDALEALSEMHVASIAAREPASHDDLEVDSGHAIHVQLFHGSANQLDLFVGKNLEGGTAVRAPSGPIVYRVDRSIRFSLSKEPREWRDRQVTHIERNHVRSVEWVNSRGTFHFDRNGDTWTPAASNPPIERLDTARLNQTITNMLELRATDFAAPGANTGITDSSPRVTINVDNGDPVTLKLGSNNGESEVFVQRVGTDNVFTLGRSHSSEIDFDPSTVQAPVPTAGDAGAGDAGRGDAAATPPPTAPSAAGGDAGSIPPEVMEQIRRQLQQRGMQMPH